MNKILTNWQVPATGPASETALPRSVQPVLDKKSDLWVRMTCWIIQTCAHP